MTAESAAITNTEILKSYGESAHLRPLGEILKGMGLMPVKETDNLRIWKSVEETDPTQTRQVKLGREFTAIDPYWKLRRATEQFGPAGMGWGWSVDQVLVLETIAEVAVIVRLWHGSPNKSHEFFCAVGQCGLFLDNDRKKPDGDCVKKAMTDAVTKGLSYLGFSADVFMGRFDDQKYVAAMREKYGPQSPDYEAAKAWGDAMIEELNMAKNIDELEKVTTRGKTDFQRFWKHESPSIREIAQTVKGVVNSRREGLKNEGSA